MSARDVLSRLSLAVLYGGRSGERDVSLASARCVIDALEEGGYSLRKIDTGEARWWLQLEGIDLAFNIQHGAGGEDGVTQGLLESMDIVGTGSGVLASALAMDKLRCKRLWQAMGLPTADFAVVSEVEQLAAVVADWGALFLKPAREGSSLGMSRVDSDSDLAAALELALSHDATVIAERYIDGPEYTVAVLGDRCLPPIRVEADSVFYDYQAKYHSDATRYHIPCGLDEAEERELCELVLRAFDAIEGEVWGRVDLMRARSGAFQLLEVNTIPGMTSHSLVPMAARAAGLGMAELLEEILWRSWVRSRGEDAVA
jgi:D-alanine-D-alanine ligase